MVAEGKMAPQEGTKEEEEDPVVVATAENASKAEENGSNGSSNGSNSNGAASATVTVEGATEAAAAANKEDDVEAQVPLLVFPGEFFREIERRYDNGPQNGGAGAGSHHHHFNLPPLPHLPSALPLAQQIRDIEVFENGTTYLLYLTAPINVVMVAIGFLHRADCPIDIRLPRYLFFGGLAGLMATLLRVVMECKWRSVAKNQRGIKFDPKYHPGLSMVRTVMYIFLVFVVAWNINATSHVFSVGPVESEDASSPRYCHPTAYALAYALVILFDCVAGLFFLCWLVGIVAGLCNPDFLVLHGYFPSATEIGGFTRFSPRHRKERKKQKLEEEEEEKAEERRRRSMLKLKRAATVDVGLLQQRSATLPANAKPDTAPTATTTAAEPEPAVVELRRERDDRATENLRRLKELSKASLSVPSAATAKTSSTSAPVEKSDSRGGGARAVRSSASPSSSATSDDGCSGDSDTDDGDESEDDFVSNLSIVRFAQVVNSRRISDVGTSWGGAGAAGAEDSATGPKLDITNFPSGPLFQKKSGEEGGSKKDGRGGEEMEMKEKKI